MFGSACSINGAGDRIAIGAYNNDFNGPMSGQAKMYEFNGASWTQMGTDINGVGDYYRCGAAISMNSIGNIVAVGSP